MTKRQTKVVKFPNENLLTAGITVIVAVLCYWFWAFPHRAALAYREEMQLFQTTGAYFTTLASRPGGIAVYTGEFLTQFFNNYWIGAGVMTLLMAMSVTLNFIMIRKFERYARTSLALALAGVPTVSLWLYLGNPFVCVSFVTALLISVGGACLFPVRATHHASKGFVFMIVGTALIYWAAGPAAVVFLLLAIILFIRKVKVNRLWKSVYAGASLLWLAVNVLVWGRDLPYPMSYQLVGIGYILTPDVLQAGQVIVEALCVAVPPSVMFFNRKRPGVVAAVIAATGAVAFGVIYPKAYDRLTYVLIDYDYLVRAGDWEGILRHSEAANPELPISVSATNLALGMTGQLDSRAFDYFQRGVEGLVPPFAKETLSSWTTGEIFFQLGMINSAQRFYFEGMEAIPNYNKSPRALKRLAETAMIRGEYGVAEKYLRLLENTLFYRGWARRNLELLRTPDGVAKHPLYGRLRSGMVDEEYMFSEGELDKTFGQLFLKNPANTLAKQYLVVYPLLERDLDKFVQYMGIVVDADPQYNPLLAQQVMAFMAMKKGQTLPPGAVRPVVEETLRGFARAWTSKNAEMLSPYRHTLFYYLLSDE